MEPRDGPEEIRDEASIHTEKLKSLELNCSYQNCQEEDVFECSAFSNHGDTVNMEQTYSNKERIYHTCKSSKQCFEIGECDKMDNLPMNLQRKVGTYTSKKMCSRDHFLLFEESLILGDEILDADFKIHRQQHDTFSSLQNKNDGKACSTEIVCNSELHCHSNKEDKMKLYMDLELEYYNTKHNPLGKHSAQEEVGTLGIPAPEVINMVATNYKAICDLNHDYHFRNASFASDSVKGLNEEIIMPTAASVERLKQAKDLISLEGHKDMDSRNSGEKHIHTLVLRPDSIDYVRLPTDKSSCSDNLKIILEHDPENCQGIHEITSFYGTKVKSQSIDDELVMDTLDLNNSKLQVYDDSHVLQEQTQTVVFHSDLEDSSTDGSEDSFHTVYSTNSSYDSLQSDTLLNFFKIAEASVNEDKCFCGKVLGGEDIVGTSDHADSITTKFKCLACLDKAYTNIKMQVNQSVHATYDFSDDCTSNRLTGDETSVVSRGNNTEMSLANKFIANEWQSENCRSVGCNTDNSFIRGDVQEVGSQTIWADARENPMVTNLAAMDSVSLIQDSLKLKINEHSIDLKELSKRNFTNEKTELGSTLFSSLAELEARYKIMKEKLLKGTPLEALPPLFTEANMKTTDASYIPSTLTCNSDNSQHVQNISSVAIEGVSHRENEKKDVKVESQIDETKEEFYVHVGSLHPSVSEAEVRSLFQRYDVSEVLIHQYSMKKSFAFLIFKTARQAEMAVEEMDGKEIHGKNIKVRLIKVAGEAVSSITGIFLNLPSPDQVIFGENAEEKVSSSSSGLSMLSDSNPDPLTVVDFVPNLVTVLSSDPDDSTLAVSDLQTGTMSATNVVHCKATAPWSIANSVLPTNPSVPPKAIPNSSLPLNSSIPTMAISNSSLPSNCPRPAWTMPSSSIVPWLVPNTSPAPWQMTNSYPPSWMVNSAAHQCWWIPCTSQGPWPIPCSHAPWSMPCSSPTSWPIPCSSQAPWSMPCPSHATWPLSSPIKSPSMLKTTPIITSKASFSAPKVTAATVHSQETNTALVSSKVSCTSLAPSKTAAIVPAPCKGTNSVETPYNVSSSALASSKVGISSPSRVAICVTSQTSTERVTAPSSKMDSEVSAPANARGSIFSAPSKAMFSAVSSPSKIKGSTISSPYKMIGSAVSSPSKMTTALSKASKSALAPSMMNGISEGSSGPKFIFVPYEYQSFKDNPVQLRPVIKLPNVCGIYISQNYMMVNKFCRLMKKLTKLHPVADRAKLKELVHMVSKDDNYMPVDTIVERVSSILK